MKDPFIMMEEKGRILLEEIYPKIYTDKYDRKYYHTDPSEKKHFDSVVMRFEKETSYIKDTHIYEVKMRAESFPTILLEKTKYTDLINIDEYEGEKTFIYASCHPDGTYLFNLNKIGKDLEWVDVSCNKKTMEYTGKKTKKVCFLEKSQAFKILDITPRDIDIIEMISYDNNRIEKMITCQRQTKCLFNWLDGK